MKKGTVRLDKISRIEIDLPKAAAFDTYSLKQASEEEIKKVEKG
jgi:acetolactate decarboxylase